jgi:hypothetical protein
MKKHVKKHIKTQKKQKNKKSLGYKFGASLLQTCTPGVQF